MSRRARHFADAQPETGTIERLDGHGRGVILAGEHVVLVDDALPGEEVRFLRRRRNRRHDEATLLEILRPAPGRVPARCAVFGICGGCRWQHLSIDAQLARKQQGVLELLREQGLEPATVLPPLTADEWGYRRRARLGAKFVFKRDRVLVGFRERRKPYITDMQSCPVLAPPCDRLIGPLADLVGSLAIRERVPQIELAVADNATALVFRVLEEPGADDRAALRAFGERENVLVFLQPGGLDTVQPLDGVTPALEYSLPAFDVTLQFEPTDFLQVNGSLNRRMVSAVVDHLDVGASDSVLELFSGIGNFTLPLARRARHVTAVEGDSALVARARDNARRNGIANVDFFTDNLYQEADAAWAGSAFDLLLLDPPRAGAGAVLAHLSAVAARRIAYVSCDPRTLAADARALVADHGYTLSAAGIMDMFPHTNHVESLAVFDRRMADGDATFKARSAAARGETNSIPDQEVQAYDIHISLAQQTLTLTLPGGAVRVWPVSTARRGPGQRRDSERTPLGRHVVRARIGDGLDPRAVLQGRRPTGEIYSEVLAAQYPQRDWILGRILWLSGTQPGFNRLGDVDSMRRYIYIHGTPDSEPLGVPASHGCIRMNCDDLVELFDAVPVGTPATIANGGVDP